MKTEKELKEEIEKLEFHIVRTPTKTYVSILKAQLKTLGERNTEVKEIIEELFIQGKLRECFKDIIEEELLQKLGLEDK